MSLIYCDTFISHPTFLGGRIADYFGGLDDGLRKAELLAETRIRAREDEPDIPQHQTLHALDHYFPKSDGYVQCVLNAFGFLADRFFSVQSPGRVLFNQDSVIDWVETYSLHLSTLPLMACAINRYATSQGRDFRTFIDPVFSDAIIPIPNDSTLNKLWNNRLVETHLHYNGSALPILLWEIMLWQNGGWVNTINQDPEQKEVWNLALPQIPPQRLFKLLRFCRWIRCWLVAWVMGYNLNVNVQRTFDYYIANLQNVFLGSLRPHPPLFPGATHPGIFLHGARAANDLTKEGAFYSHVLFRLTAAPNALACRMFHLYHLVFCATQRVLSQQTQLKGFHLFNTLGKIALRDISEQRRCRERMIQVFRTGHLEGLEARISLKDDYFNTVTKKFPPIVNAYNFTNQNGQLGVNTRFGVIVHLIKENDKDFGRNAHNGNMLRIGRHCRLRDSLMIKAAILERVRSNSPFGQYVLAADGAGNELVTPPEVFASAFRKLERSSRTPHVPSNHKNLPPPPPLSFTFHAGEEFRHLASGIRAVDEAITFLDLPDGSRLGHCLAIGFDPSLWLSRAPKVRLSRLEWLDDLVHLYCLPDCNALFKGYLLTEIDRHARKIYGHTGLPLCPELLHRAWELRKLPVSGRELHSAEEQAFSNNILKNQDNDVIKLWKAYQYDSQSRLCGDLDIIEVAHKDRESQWITALTLAQESVVEKMRLKNIAIESCPVSNLRISRLKRLKEHPIFTWRRPDMAGVDGFPLDVTLATDNTGIFGTSLTLEYSAVAYAAKELGYGKKHLELERWLDAISEDSRKRSFLNF